MWHRLRTFFLAGVLLSTALACRGGDAQPATAASGLQDSDIRQIREREQEFVRAELARDIQAMLALRTDDIVWMGPGAPAVEGKNAVRAMFESSPPTLEFQTTPVHTEGSGDLAWHRGTFRHAALVGADTVRSSGKYLQVWRREGGTWRIAADIFNSDS